MSAAHQSRRRLQARPVALRGAGRRRFPARRAASSSRRGVRPKTARRAAELHDFAACQGKQQESKR
eukprot:11873702-Alexandrium_andersonii.AAC.1